MSGEYYSLYMEHKAVIDYAADRERMETHLATRLTWWRVDRLLLGAAIGSMGAFSMFALAGLAILASAAAGTVIICGMLEMEASRVVRSEEQQAYEALSRMESLLASAEIGRSE